MYIKGCSDTIWMQPALHRWTSSRHSLYLWSTFFLSTFKGLEVLFLSVHAWSFPPWLHPFFALAFLSGKGCMQRHAIALCTHSLAKQKGEKSNMKSELKEAESRKIPVQFDLAFLVWEVDVCTSWANILAFNFMLHLAAAMAQRNITRLPNYRCSHNPVRRSRVKFGFWDVSACVLALERVQKGSLQ